MNLELLTSSLGLIGFAVASVLSLFAFQRRERQTELTRFGFISFTIGTIACSLTLVNPLVLTPGHLAAPLLCSAVAWLTVLAQIRFKLKLLGTFVAPFITLVLLIHFFVVPNPTAHGQGSPALLIFHIGSSMLGVACAIMATAVALVFLWQRSLLKKKMLDQLPKGLPSLDRLENLLTVSLWSGFLLLTCGLLTGAIYTQAFAAPIEMHLEMKTAWSLSVWLWYMATLVAKNIFKGPQKRIAWLSVGGFLLLSLSFFGIGFAQ